MLLNMNHPPTFTEAVAAELRAYLARQGIRTADLARSLGVTHSWIARRLTGQTSSTLEDLRLICAALGVSAGVVIASAEQARAEALAA